MSSINVIEIFDSSFKHKHLKKGRLKAALNKTCNLTFFVFGKPGQTS